MATKTTKDALAKMETLQEAWTAARSEARDLGTQHTTMSDKVVGLVNQRRGLIKSDPTLIDHTDAPVSESNAVGKINAEIAKLDEQMGGGLIALQAKVDHARKVEAKRREDWASFVRANFEEIREALRPSAEAARDRVHDAIAATRAAADEYLASVHRFTALATAAGISGQQVTALDPVAELQRTLDGWELPLPTDLR